MRRPFRPLSFILLWVFSVAALASVTEVQLADLKPQRGHRQAALIVAQVISKYHYKPSSLDDKLSEAIFDRYFKSLDPNRSHFTQGEIDGFASQRHRMDDSLRNARMEPVFDIFVAYRKRVEERVAYALALLEQEFRFDQDETYQFDREKAPWPKGQAELDDLWRQRVKNDVLALRMSGKELPQIRETLRKRYEGILRRTRQLDADDVFQTFLNAYTLSLEPHTAYMSPRTSENFDISMSLSLEGIGAVLELDNEFTTVQKVVAGGPAELSKKVNAGDRILGVAQGEEAEVVDVVGWRLQDVVDLIRGPKGSVVRLQLQSKEGGVGGPTRLVTLTRDKIKLEDQAAKSYVIEGLEGMEGTRIGVIDLPTFYRDFAGFSNGDEDSRSTTKDVRRLLGELKRLGVDGVVIDLRDNGGGALTEATELTGLFIPEGPVVQVRRADGSLEVERDPDPELVYGGPLAVLVDRYSASASEIFAGAIQDYKRGIIIGEPTFGKGTVQTLIDLENYVFRSEDKLGRLRLTMAQFFRVNGGSTQFKGVVPDVTYPMAATAGDEGERSLENALPWASIAPASFTPSRMSALDKVKASSARRVATDPGFIYLTQEQQAIKAVRDQKSVSLLEAKRKAEWELRDESRRERLNRFRLSAGLPPVKEDKFKDEEEEKPVAEKSDDEELIDRIQVKEAARILSDYILSGRPRAASVH